jgi:hypothetical protein
MKYSSREDVAELISTLNQAPAEWLLLRNSGGELPDRLPDGKDVDVLARFESRGEMQRFLEGRGYTRVRHPLRSEKRLYGVHPFEMYRTRRGVLLDVCFDIAVRSLDRGQWIPLDQLIQASAWENRVFRRLATQDVPMLGNEDLFVTMVARCMFDKREFSAWHSDTLSRLLATGDEKKILDRLGVIFFGYGQRLLDHIRAKRFALIVRDYLSYSDY